MTTTGSAPAATDTLQMVRAEVNVRDFQRWMGTRRLQDPDHAMHCLLTECFGSPPSMEHPERQGLAPKPFRLMVTRGAATGCLYGYGHADADAMRDAAAVCADPLQTRILPAAGMDSKPMPSEWQAGRRLGFEVRIRPVMRHPNREACRRSDESCYKLRLPRKSQCENCRPNPEQDAFLHEALQYPEKGGMTRTREQVYAEWLSNRLEGKGGATLDMASVKLVSFQRTHAYRKLRARHTEGPDAVMRGIVTIADPTKFASLLSDGIGRHRSYGYGMLLLRPARQ